MYVIIRPQARRTEEHPPPKVTRAPASVVAQAYNHEFSTPDGRPTDALYFFIWVRRDGFFGIHVLPMLLLPMCYSRHFWALRRFRELPTQSRPHYTLYRKVCTCALPPSTYPTTKARPQLGVPRADAPPAHTRPARVCLYSQMSPRRCSRAASSMLRYASKHARFPAWHTPSSAVPSSVPLCAYAHSRTHTRVKQPHR